MPWKKGESGNPARKFGEPDGNTPGRPLGSVDLMGRVRKLLLAEVKAGRLKADDAAEVYTDRMLEGEHKFFADFLDREDGRPAQSVQHTGTITLVPMILEGAPPDMLTAGDNE